MNTKELNEAIALLVEVDPAEATDLADRIVDALAARLEDSEELDGSPKD